MLYPEVSKLMKGMDSRYSLVIATAKRARQLASDVSDDRPVSHAIAEIAAGKIKCIKRAKQRKRSRKKHKQSRLNPNKTLSNNGCAGIYKHRKRCA